MVKTLINGKYNILLPEHRAARPEWKIENGGWEVARIEEMLSTVRALQYGADFGGEESYRPIVFDIGTEEGDISAILSKYGCCKMVLVEPNNRVWPCIKAIWEANELVEPVGFFGGFLSNENKPGYEDNYVYWEDIQGKIIPDHGFKQLYEKYPDVPQIKLDDWCKESKIYPDIITMDVEGSEFEVIKGAEQTLRKHKPIIFMSVHPEFMYESYRNTGEWLERYGERQHVVHMLRFIDELGYTHRCIEYDYHELHMVFEPK